MSSRGVGTAEEGGDRVGRGQAIGGRFGKAVDEPVGPPVDSGEELAVALHGDANRKVRLVRRHPHDFAGADDGGEVVICA